MTQGIELKEGNIVHQGLTRVSGAELVDLIISMPDPKKFIRRLSSEDFYWIVKRIGIDDCLPVLELGSETQWQYLLDLEIWKKDRVDTQAIMAWLDLLRQADLQRVVRWLITDGEYLAYHHFQKSLDVIVLPSKDDVYNVPDGFFTIDGTVYIKSRNPDFNEAVQAIVTEMAHEDFLRYQSLFLGISGFAPAEVEEEMYRLRNVRLAEHGFLPFEEAISVYAFLEPHALIKKHPIALPEPQIQDDDMSLIPAWPFHQSTEGNLIAGVINSNSDSLFLDRMRLEFAGLCNQIISADGLLVNESDILQKTSAKAISYLNLALQQLCGSDLREAEKYLRNNALPDIFRVGFSLALKVKWEAERWIKNSWFARRKLDSGFWGERWGGIIRGLTGTMIPKWHTGLQGEAEFKDFEWLSELGESLKVLRFLMVLDGLIELLIEMYPADEKFLREPDFTFHPIFFNLWSKKIVGEPLSIEGITLSKARYFFNILRSFRKKPPFLMPGFKEVFVADLMSYAAPPRTDPQAATSLKEALDFIWEEFLNEYKLVSLEDIDPRYSRFITILPDQVSAAQ